jgi:hypothetical protein
MGKEQRKKAKLYEVRGVLSKVAFQAGAVASSQHDSANALSLHLLA